MSRAKELEMHLKLILDNIDYLRGYCKPTEQIAAILPKIIIENARQALETK